MIREDCKIEESVPNTILKDVERKKLEKYF